MVFNYSKFEGSYSTANENAGFETCLVVLGWQWGEDILAFSSSVDENSDQSLHK